MSSTKLRDERSIYAKQLRYQKRKERRERDMRTPAPDRDAKEAQRRRKASDVR